MQPHIIKAIISFPTTSQPVQRGATL